MAVIVVSETILSLHGRDLDLDAAVRISAASVVPSEVLRDPRACPSGGPAEQDSGIGFP